LGHRGEIVGPLDRADAVVAVARLGWCPFVEGDDRPDGLPALEGRDVETLDPLRFVAEVKARPLLGCHARRLRDRVAPGVEVLLCVLAIYPDEPELVAERRHLYRHLHTSAHI